MESLGIKCKCGGSPYYKNVVYAKGSHVGAYCSKCDKWIKWVPKKLLAANGLTSIDSVTDLVTKEVSINDK